MRMYDFAMIISTGNKVSSRTEFLPFFVFLETISKLNIINHLQIRSTFPKVWKQPRNWQKFVDFTRLEYLEYVIWLFCTKT